MGWDPAFVGLIHLVMARALSTSDVVLVEGQVLDYKTTGKAIIDAKASADFEKMIREIEVRQEYPQVTVDRPFYAEHQGRRNKSDRKRNKGDRWR